VNLLRRYGRRLGRRDPAAVWIGVHMPNDYREVVCFAFTAAWILPQ
jgi:hypothetical protein